MGFPHSRVARGETAWTCRARFAARPRGSGRSPKSAACATCLLPSGVWIAHSLRARVASSPTRSPVHCSPPRHLSPCRLHARCLAGPDQDSTHSSAGCTRRRRAAHGAGSRHPAETCLPATADCALRISGLPTQADRSSPCRSAAGVSPAPSARPGFGATPPKRLSDSPSPSFESRRHRHRFALASSWRFARSLCRTASLRRRPRSVSRWGLLFDRLAAV